jgi:hypothetical protein
MTTSAVRVGVGTHFAYDGEVVEVVELIATLAGNEVLLKGTRDQRVGRVALNWVGRTEKDPPSGHLAVRPTQFVSDGVPQKPSRRAKPNGSRPLCSKQASWCRLTLLLGQAITRTMSNGS